MDQHRNLTEIVAEYFHSAVVYFECFAMIKIRASQTSVGALINTLFLEFNSKIDLISS